MILQYFMTKCPRMVIFLDGYNIYNLVFNYFYTICFCSMAKMQNSISRHWLAISYNKCFFYICNTQLLDHCLLAFGINTDKLFENNFFSFYLLHFTYLMWICIIVNSGYIIVITSINMSVFFIKQWFKLKGFLKYK